MYLHKKKNKDVSGIIGDRGFNCVYCSTIKNTELNTVHKLQLISINYSM